MLNFKNKKDLKAKISLFLIMICSFVGVGFVSGSEIFEFFLRFGRAAYIGVAIFLVLVFAIIYKMLVYSKVPVSASVPQNNFKNKAENKQKFATKNAKIKIKEAVFGLNSFIISGAMFAGIKYFLHSIFPENFILVYLICLFCVFLILMFGVKILSAFDVFVFAIVCCLIGFFAINLQPNAIENTPIFSAKTAFLAMLFSVLYVFMNLFTMQPLIDICDASFSSKKECRVFAGVFSAVLTLILIVFLQMLGSNRGFIVFSMPFLEFFKSHGGIFKFVFCAGLVLAIVSTQVSGLLGLKNKIKKIIRLGDFSLSFTVFLLCFIFGLVPFKIFVSIFYPILGLVNLLTFVFC